MSCERRSGTLSGRRQAIGFAGQIDLADGDPTAFSNETGSFSKETHSEGPRRRAFSLVELFVVMVILGMLAGLVAVRTRGYLISSKQNAARAEIANIVKAIETFYADQGRYPTTDEGLQILAEGTDSWPDGFLTKIPLDPWKQPYEYVSPGSSSPYEVVCLGADHREGGDGEDRDISSESLGDAES